MHKHTKFSLLIIVVLVLTGLGAWLQFKNKGSEVVSVPATNFEECVTNGNPIMESYPRQCQDGEATFTEHIGNELEKMNMIRLESPRPNDVVRSPLVIKGEARGYWFFEASFPIMVVDWDGRIIGEGYATADGEWMTVEFVPFTATVNFTVDPEVYSKRGSLILQKNNASGLPEHDDALEIPIMYE